MRWPLILCGLLGTVGCASEDSRPATFRYISPAIIQPNCATAGCHSKFTYAAGFALETVEGGYLALVGGTSDVDGQNFVVPGEPVRSKLLFLLEGDEVWRMPPDQPLPDPDIDLIERWILEGAVLE